MKSSSPADRGCPASILLVDDNKHGLIARRTVLQEMHYEVTTAGNGEEALELFSRQHFDLVITDHRMPRMTGVELIQKLKAIRPALPVVLLSGFVDPLGLDERSTGADAVIAKSANEVSHLLRATAKLLNRRPARKPPKSIRQAAAAKAESGS
jgi:CheY-like chemotaxis protein